VATEEKGAAVRKVVGVLLGLALPTAAGMAQVTPTQAAPAQAAGQAQRFVLSGRVEAPSLTLVAGGAINGVGSLTAESVDYRPSDRTYRETDLAVIGDGTLTLSFTGAFDTWPFTLDPRTCTRHGGLSGTWSVTGAGGTFAGATGHGTFSGRFLTYAGRTAAGCDEAAIKGFVTGPMTGSLSLMGTPPPVGG
jgi:hypothetical protein